MRGKILCKDILKVKYTEKENNLIGKREYTLEKKCSINNSRTRHGKYSKWRMENILLVR